MIDTATCVWFVAGLLIGFAHAMTLWRATRRYTALAAVLGLLRLAAVAGVLILAALSGAILAAAAGWLIGFAGLAAWFVLSRNGRAAASPRPQSRE
jgi:hypothetical protein